MLEGMREEITKTSNGDEGLKDREQIKAKISGLNSQLDALTARLSMLPKTVSPLSFLSRWKRLDLRRSF